MNAHRFVKSIGLMLLMAWTSSGSEAPSGNVKGVVKLDTVPLVRQTRGYEGYPSLTVDSELARKDPKQKVLTELIIYIADNKPDDGRFNGVSYRGAQSAIVPEIVQTGKKFIPHVLPVVVGATVSFPNRDPFFHNVFSLSPISKFDLGKYNDKAPPRRYVFEKPGLSQIFCDIHRNMKSYVLVLENPFYCQPNKDGNFAINNVPVGRWVLFVWHPELPDYSRTIEVKSDETLELEINPVMASK